jgi:hypothetical protein
MIGRTKNRLAGTLERLDWHLPFLSAISDHYLADLITKPKPENNG